MGYKQIYKFIVAAASGSRLPIPLVGLFVVLCCAFGCEVNGQAVDVDSFDPAVLDDQQSLVEFFSVPRFAVLWLAEDGETRKLVTKKLRKEHQTELAGILESTTAESRLEMNAYWVVRYHDMGARLDLVEAELSSQLHSGLPSEESRLKVFCGMLTDLAEITSGFRSVAQHGSRAAQVNHLYMLKTVETLRARQPLFDGEQDQTNQPEGAVFSDKSMKTIRSHVVKLRELQSEMDRATARFDELIKSGYWPATEAALRDAYDRGEEISKIEALANQLLSLKKLDATAKCLAAGALFQAAESRGEQPPTTIEAIAREAADAGTSLGYMILAHYYHSVRKPAERMKALQMGAASGCEDCMTMITDEYISSGDFEAVRDTFIRVLTVELLLNGPDEAEGFAVAYSTAVFESCTRNLESNKNVNFQGFQMALYSFKIGFEQIAAKYREQGDHAGSKRAIAHATRFGDAANRMAPRLDSESGRGEWNQRQDEMLERRLERQTEARNQIRRETETQNKRIDSKL